MAGVGVTAPSAPSPLAQLVLSRIQAKFPNLDPKAVLAVGSMEGLSGRIGDGGHAFGFSQENNAGGVLTGRFPGATPAQLEAWANSPAGIDDALSRMSSVAGGLKGQAAINAIVSRYERPANIPGEIAGASAAYGGQPSLASESIGAPSAGALTGASMPGAAGTAQNAKLSILNALMASNASLANGGAASSAQTLQLLQALPALKAAESSIPGSAGAPGGVQPLPAGSSGGGALGQNIVGAAKAYLGVPYVYGGNNPKTGLDCSSFVQHALADSGIQVGRTTTDQIKQGQPVGLHQLQPGDVVFTEPGKGPGGGPGHEGLYIGKGTIQESPHTGTVNSKIPLTQFLGGGLVGIRRYAPSGPQKA